MGMVCKNCNYYTEPKCYLNMFAVTNQNENDWCFGFRFRLSDGGLKILDNFKTITIDFAKGSNHGKK